MRVLYATAAAALVTGTVLVWGVSGCGDEGGGTAGDVDASRSICGNGVVETGEECDDGPGNSDTQPNACRTDCTAPRCGDGVMDDGEECDGLDLGDQTCADLPGFGAGALSCRPNCTLDTSQCSGCGNGVAEGVEGEGGYEECDGDDLRGATCESLGRPLGQLICSTDCHYDFRYCTGVLPPAITSITGTGSASPVNPRQEDQQAFQQVFEATPPHQRHLADQRISSEERELVIQGTSLSNVESITAEGKEGQGTIIFELRGGTDTMLRIRFPAALAVTAAGLFTLTVVTNHGFAEADVFFLQGEQGPAGPPGECTCDASTLAPAVAADLKQDQDFVADVAAAAADQAVPPGTVVAYVGDISGGIPEGWLLCDGSAVSRTTYARLFQVIGVSHGIGDGVATFNLPDLRGRFPRGVDMGAGRDPDADSRQAPATGGNEGDAVGSVQGYATARPVSSPFVTNTAGQHTHRYFYTDHNFGGDPNAGGYNDCWCPRGPTAVWGDTNPAGNHNHTITSGGDAETRPENLGVYYLIKY